MSHAHDRTQQPFAPVEGQWLGKLATALSADFATIEANPSSTMTLGIAGLRVEMRLFGGWDVPERVLSVAHLVTQPVVSPDLTITAWDNRALELTLPDQGWFRSRALGLQAFIGDEPASAEIIDVGDRRCLSWVSDAARQPLTSVYRPFGTVLACWLPTQGVPLLHAAAVGDARGAVLIVGPSGAGKSTTSLVCSERGLPLIADDFCAIDVSARSIQVHSLFRSVKLRRDSAGRLDANMATAHGIDEHYQNLPSDRVSIEAPVVAVVVVRPDSSTRTTICTEVPFQDRLKLLGSTGLMAGIGGEATIRPWLRSLHSLAKQPTYRLRLGWDLDGVASSVAAIRDRHAIDPVER